MGTAEITLVDFGPAADKLTVDKGEGMTRVQKRRLVQVQLFLVVFVAFSAWVSDHRDTRGHPIASCEAGSFSQG
jgi:hypothetical protein